MELDSKLNLIDLIVEKISSLESTINLKQDEGESNILIFSLAGNNTPCIVMICYLIIKYNYSLKKALIYVCKKIPNYHIKKKYFKIIKSKFT